jgi:Secretion system C-terminal sorting domain
VNDELASGGLLIKTDISGNFQWVYQFNFAIDVCKVTSDKGAVLMLPVFFTAAVIWYNYLLAGRNGLTGFFLYKVNPSGAVIFRKNYTTGLVMYDDAADKYMFDVVEYPNGDYFLLINLGPGVFIERVDSSGTPVWLKKYLNDDWTDGTGSLAGGGKLLLMPNGSIMVSGKKPDNGLLVFKIDINGNILWSKSYYSSFPPSPKSAFLNTDGTITLYAHKKTLPKAHILVDIDTSGTLLDAHAIRHTAYSINPLWISSGNNNNKLLLQEIADTNSVFGYGKTSIHQIGISLSNQCLMDSSLSFTDSANVLALPQDLFVFADSAQSPQTIGCIATDHNFLNYNICLDIGIDEDSQAKFALLLFPNPFSTQAMITFGKEIHDATFHLYNLFGQLVQEKNNISGSEIILNRENLGSGVYVFEVIETGNKIYSGKAVVY